MFNTGLLASRRAPHPIGQISFNSAGTWTVPANVTRVSLVLIGRGGNGIQSTNDISGGGGGGLVYANDVSVSPGQSIEIGIDTTSTRFGTVMTAFAGGVGRTFTAAPGGSFSATVPATGFNGGSGQLASGTDAAGGGAGQYTAPGVNGSPQGTPAAGTTGSTIPQYGAGGNSSFIGNPTQGQGGVVRIIWGAGRSYPNNAI